MLLAESTFTFEEFRIRMSKEISLTPKCLVCSYCNADMEIGSHNVKKKVPAGAKDLGLTETIQCWKCPNCGLKSKDYLVECGCGSLVLDGREPFLSSEDLRPISGSGLFGYLRSYSNYDFETEESTSGSRCLNCIRCSRCNGSLDSTFVETIFTKEYYNGSETESHWSFYHPDCHEASRIESERRAVQQEAETTLRRRKEASAERWSNGFSLGKVFGSIGAVIGGVIGACGGVMIAGERIAGIRDPSTVGIDLMFGVPIKGLLIGSVIGAVILFALGFLGGLAKR